MEKIYLSTSNQFSLGITAASAPLCPDRHRILAPSGDWQLGISVNHQ